MSGALRIDLFGTMRALVDGEPLPKVRSRKAKWLLAILALQGEKPVARSVVAGMLWPDTDGAIALTNLRSVINDLRQALGSQAHRLQAPDRKTLAFDLDGAEVDVLAFDAAIRANELEPAVELYAGPLLQDCDEEWATAERNARERACLAALHEMAQGADPVRAIPLFQRAVEIAPGQDAPRRDLMHAYVRAGELNLALARYAEYAQWLRTESKGVPDTQTTELFVRLRAMAPSPAAKGSLPSPGTSFVGREDERSEIAGDLRTRRLVTLTGMGGVGKTRLAREAAQAAAFVDGAWFVPLEAVHEEGGVLRAAIAALRLGEPGAPRLERLIETLQSKRLLLVLDNCEHLRGACARLVERLLAECPTLCILATSREPLGISGEKIWPVSGLTVPDSRHLPHHPATLLRVLKSYESVELFLERAKAACRFEISRENAVAVAELCERLEGLPLAIELAASQTRTTTVADMIGRLEERRLDVLVGDRPSGSPRHQTLRAALDWSYSLLGSQERRLFARLAAFSGGWTLEAAQAVANAGPALLDSLVEKSLVTFSPDGRYGLLETVREYAANKLEASGEARRIEKLHGDYYAGLAERWVAEYAPLGAFEREHGNFDAAMEHAKDDLPATVRLVVALMRFLRETFTTDAAAARLEYALERADSKPSLVRAKALRSLGLLRGQKDKAAGIGLQEESLRVSRAIGDRFGMVRSLHGLGLAAFYAGNYPQAAEYLEETVALARATEDFYPLAFALGALALVRIQRGHYAQVGVEAEESLALMRTVGSPGDVASALRTLARIAHDFADHDAYRRHNEEALELFRLAGNEGGAAWCLDDLGKDAAERGEVAQGQKTLERALETMRAINDRYGIGSVLESLGQNHIVENEPDEARKRFEESLAVFHALEHRVGIARVKDGLGDVARAEGSVEAETYYRESFALWQEVGDRKRLRDGLLRFADGETDPRRTIQLLAAAERLGAEMGIPVPLRLRDRRAKAMRQARSLPEFEQEWRNALDVPLHVAFDLVLVP